MNGCCVGAELVGQLQRVASSVFLLHSGDDEGRQVLCGLDVETSAGRRLDASATAGPLDVLRFSGKGAGNRQDFAWLDADVLRQSLDPGSRTWRPDQSQISSTEQSVWTWTPQTAF